MPNQGFQLILIELVAIAALTIVGCVAISAAIDARSASPAVNVEGL